MLSAAANRHSQCAPWRRCPAAEPPMLKTFGQPDVDLRQDNSEVSPNFASVCSNENRSNRSVVATASRSSKRPASGAKQQTPGGSPPSARPSRGAQCVARFREWLVEICEEDPEVEEMYNSCRKPGTSVRGAAIRADAVHIDGKWLFSAFHPQHHHCSCTTVSACRPCVMRFGDRPQQVTFAERVDVWEIPSTSSTAPCDAPF